MKVKYRHISDPDTEKIYDSDVALSRNRFIQQTPEEFAEFEKKNFARKKAEGLIIEYEIVDDTTAKEG